MKLKIVVLVTTALFALLLISLPTTASVPPMVSYQGKLMTPGGSPVPDGAYSIRFAIYDAAADGNTLWSETNPGVQVKGGLFAVMLGSVVNLPANIFDDPNRYFGVKVGTDEEMTPRQQIASAPFAFRSATAATVDDGAITSAKLADGCITAAKIGSGAITIQNIAAEALTPVGAVSIFAGATAPTGWLLCDGSAVSRTDYAALFAAIGTTYGPGDGSATFSLPDLRSRVVAGTDAASVPFNSLGKTGGETNHTLALTELPSHGHAVSDPGHSHNGINGKGFVTTGTNSGVICGAAGGTALLFREAFVTNAALTGVSIQQTGGGQAFSNLQPYLAMNYIIKH